jgi:hypothetical protein
LDPVSGASRGGGAGEAGIPIRYRKRVSEYLRQIAEDLGRDDADRGGGQ